MKNLKTLLLFGLTMLGSCQKQEQKQDTTDVTVSMPVSDAPFAPTIAPDSVAPDGYMFCAQSELEFQENDSPAGYSTHLVWVYKNKNNVCVPCTQVTKTGAVLTGANKYAETILVKTDIGRVPASIHSTSLGRFADELAENCSFKEMTLNRPPHPNFQYRPGQSLR